LQIDDACCVKILSGLAGALVLAFTFYGYIHPQTPARMVKNAAALIPQSTFWSLVTTLPFPVPRSAGVLTLTLVGINVLAFAAYAAAVAICWNRLSSRRTLLAVALPAAGFFALSALALPTQSTDIHDYILTGRVAAVHGSNPVLVAPDAFPDDPLYPYAQGRYTDEPQKKGPAWVAVTTTWAALAGDNPVTVVLAYRLGFLAFNLANLVLLVVSLRRWRPEHVLAGTVLYGWNPIVVVYGQQKTDTIMVCLLLVAVMLWFSGRHRMSVVALSASVFVKLLTLPLLAAYFVRELAAHRWRQAISSALLVGLVVIALYAPFTRDVGLLIEHVSQIRRAGTGPGGSSLPQLAILVLTLVGAVLVVRAGVVGQRGDEHSLRAWALVALFFAVFFYPSQWSWYLMTPIALVALAGERWLTLMTIALSFVSFSFNVWAQSSHRDFPLPDIEFLPRPMLFLAVLALITASTAGLLALRRAIVGRSLEDVVAGQGGTVDDQSRNR
jgi:hypothetical protein